MPDGSINHYDDSVRLFKKTLNPKGAGRKPVPKELARVRTQISLTPELMAKFKELGGSRWLAKVINDTKC